MMIAVASRSTAFARKCGWNLPPSAEVLASQLQALGEMHRIGTSENIGQKLAVAIPDIYKSLTQQPAQALQEACLSLQNQPCVLVGSGFVQPDHVAFR